ncbi:hypothetical protein RMATCC62417_11553 [Rhizopus microsporus]|nr:hypothetical protein RMATCC62417_11553 [Rhizopus microsporus]
MHELDKNQKHDLEGANGSAVELIKHFTNAKEPAILVALDYAGLSINIRDLEEFIIKHSNITKIKQLPEWKEKMRW